MSVTVLFVAKWVNLVYYLHTQYTMWRHTATNYQTLLIYSKGSDLGYLKFYNRLLIYK